MERASWRSRAVTVSYLRTYGAKGFTALKPRTDLLTNLATSSFGESMRIALRSRYGLFLEVAELEVLSLSWRDRSILLRYLSRDDLEARWGCCYRLLRILLFASWNTHLAFSW